MSPPRRMLRDPLAHFVLGGALLFALYAALGGRAGAGRTIVVNRAALAAYLANRAGPLFDAAAFDRMSRPEQAELARTFVREEALAREAIALGLERDDVVIQRRLVQKLEFVAQGFADASTELSDAELERFLAAHRADYAVPALVTFTHVFFDAEVHGRGAALALATRARAQQSARGARFEDAVQLGDRFPYFVNYVDRPPDLVADHFGPEMARALFSLAPDASAWRGPFVSPLGAHVVLLTKRSDARDPPLAEVRSRVLDDARRARTRERSEAALAEIVARYPVRDELGLLVPGGARP